MFLPMFKDFQFLYLFAQLTIIQLLKFRRSDLIKWILLFLLLVSLVIGEDKHLSKYHVDITSSSFVNSEFCFAWHGALCLLFPYRKYALVPPHFLNQPHRGVMLSQVYNRFL